MWAHDPAAGAKAVRNPDTDLGGGPSLQPKGTRFGYNVSSPQVLDGGHKTLELDNRAIYPTPTPPPNALFHSPITFFDGGGRSPGRHAPGGWSWGRRVGGLLHRKFGRLCPTHVWARVP